MPAFPLSTPPRPPRGANSSKAPRAQAEPYAKPAGKGANEGEKGETGNEDQSEVAIEIDQL